MPDLTPTSSVGTGFGEKSFLPWIIALVAAVGLIVVALVVLSSASDDGSPSDSVPSQEVQDAQSGLRTAQTTIETFALDNNGSYAGATAEGLVALEGTLGDLEGLTVSGQSTGYTLSATAGDVTFTITRSGDGVVVFSCTPPGGSGCDDTGTWGVDAV